jgi:hypothetical protein
MKKFTILAILIFCTVTSFAQVEPRQGRFNFSLGLEAGYTAGPYAQRWNVGAGGTGQLEYFVRDNISMTLLSGYVGYLGDKESSGLKYRSINIVPVKAGVRFYLGRSFHVGGELGAGFLGNGGSHTTAFAYSPIIGFNFKTRDSEGQRGGVDISIKYDGYTFNDGDVPNGLGNTFAAVGLRIAYVF